jgi:8-oxo-dGTP pyrophosphatase MutT (NUDIX family)
MPLKKIAYSVANDSATAAGVVFHANGKVLMMQRPDGTWGFPAGSLENGETAEAAARRQTIEETGYAHQGDLTSIGIFDGFFHAFFADVEQFDPSINDEHMGCGWFRLDELPVPLHGCSGNVLACVFNAMAGDAAESAKQYDINGFFEVMDNPVSKVGVFQYLGKNIPQEVAKGNSDKGFAVYRPAEELADPACIASLRLKPWIIDHTMIGDGTGGTVQIEDKQARGVTGERCWFDPADDYGTLKTNIMCWSEFLAQSIAAGKDPLSLGYRCVYEYKPGVFNGVPYTYVQRRIRFNHLATVDDGRMGPEVSVMDGFSTTEKFRMDKKQREALLKAKQKSLVGVVRNRLMAFAGDAAEAVAKGEDEGGEMAEAVKTIEQVAPLLEALEGIKSIGESDVLALDEETGAPETPVGDTAQMPGDERSKANNGLTGDGEDPDKDKPKEGNGMDAAEITKIVNKAVKDAMQGVGLDSREVVRVLADRDMLAKQVGEHIADFAHVSATMDAAEIAKYAAEKLEIPAVTGQEIVAVKAWLHNRIPAHKLPTAHAGDSSDKSRKPSFLEAQLNERK